MAKETKYLFFDTEMSGCEQLVSVGYLLTDNKGVKIRDDYFLIKPHKAIRKSTIAIHGITTNEAKKKGITLKRGLARLNNAFKDASVIVGFAPQNDLVAIGIACRQMHTSTPLVRGDSLIVDVARMGTPYMIEQEKIVHGQTPSLETLYAQLFNGREYQVHNALSDTEATAECFWKLLTDGYYSFESILPYAKVKHLLEGKKKLAPTPIIDTAQEGQDPLDNKTLKDIIA